LPSFCISMSGQYLWKLLTVVRRQFELVKRARSSL
jgi:hypothetical protein